MMAILIPSKKQWKRWSLPSKAAYIALILAIVALTFQVIKLIPPKVKDQHCNINTPIDCPLIIDVYGFAIPHTSGSIVEGIVWKKKYVDVRVLLINESESKIHNISFLIDPQYQITEAVQATTVPNVNIFPEHGPAQEIALEYKTEDGETKYHAASTSDGYTASSIIIQCSELLSKGEIKIVTACIAINSNISGNPPKWVDIQGLYETYDAGKHVRYRYKHRFQLDAGD